MSFKEMACVSGTTPVGVKKYMDGKGMVVIKNGKSYKIPSMISRRYLEIRGAKCPKEIVAIENCKGGVGKTFATHTLASLHSMMWGADLGYRTLVIDMDFQGNLTTSFRASKKIGICKSIFDAYTDNLPIEKCLVPITDSLDLIPSNSMLSLLDNQLLVDQVPLDNFLKKLLAPIRSNYSCIFIDCPPRISPITTAINLYSSIVLFVTDLDEFAVDGIDTMFTHMASLTNKYEDKLNAIPKIFINKFDAREQLSFSYITQLKSKYDAILLNSYISKSTIVKNSFKDKKLLWENTKTSPIFTDTIEVYLELFDLQNQMRQKMKQ